MGSSLALANTFGNTAGRGYHKTKWQSKLHFENEFKLLFCRNKL